jgi:hypothetical protein
MFRRSARNAKTSSAGRAIVAVFWNLSWAREGRPLLRLGVTLARPFLLSPERGADTIVYLASSPDVTGENGGYYVKRQRREPSAAVRDDAAARKPWEISEKMTGLAPARAAGA